MKKILNRRFALRLATALLLLLLAVYIIYQVYSVMYPPYKSETAVMFSVQDGVRCTGIAVRSEQVVTDNTHGFKHYLKNDGDKTAKGSAVAEVYPSVEAARNALYIKRIEEEAQTFDTMMRTGSLSGVNIDSVRSALRRRLTRLSSLLYSGDYESALNEQYGLYKEMGSFLSASGNVIDYTNIKQTLAAMIEQAKSSDHESVDYVYTDIDGYFSSDTDGYESVLSPESVKNMSVAEIEKLITEAGATGADDGCKTISDFTWYFAAVMSKSEAARFEKGRSIKIEFSNTALDNVPSIVNSIISDESSDKTVVLLECDYLNSAMTGLRVSDAMLGFEKYDGIKIRRSALRIVDGVTGVFVKNDSKIEFKKIDTIYETEEYLISSSNITDSEYLRLYDEIILEGKDLYVGKELKW